MTETRQRRHKARRYRKPNVIDLRLNGLHYVAPAWEKQDVATAFVMTELQARDMEVLTGRRDQLFGVPVRVRAAE